ncbi:MAG TPA: helix-turn-helix transcriptional regulator [Chitinophagales bacterium]|nr:helix-turn-helix transcriptional regulator [Chitinophagales bacterium]HRG29385.1 helix-turn-helix transcriptional regulator [Chitinophagales bacterium]HRG85201.1 helix-turn-helix transcriptional regulator [Chitinophagales bacterium]HRH52276.1 helix-turn-helix transcriptional regulator [Chitinophagales bacterium]
MENKGRYIPNNLIKYRKMLGLKQEEVASYLGLKSTNRLSRWEQGLSMPSAQNLFKLSTLYHTLIDQLYSDHVSHIKRNMSENEELLDSSHPKK